MVHVSAELARIVDAAENVFRRVSDEESGRPVLPGGWSRKQLLGHLIESASNNHQRFVRAALADALDFPAFDTPGRSACKQRRVRHGRCWWIFGRAITAISPT
jgi:hypothetical protein